LDVKDYALAALSSSFATLSNSSQIGWKEVDVTEQVRDDFSNARSFSQFRLHFEKEVTGTNLDGDYVFFESSENTLETGNTPQLLVKYFLNPVNFSTP